MQTKWAELDNKMRHVCNGRTDGIGDQVTGIG